MMKIVKEVIHAMTMHSRIRTVDEHRRVNLVINLSECNKFTFVDLEKPCLSEFYKHFNGRKMARTYKNVCRSNKCCYFFKNKGESKESNQN